MPAALLATVGVVVTTLLTGARGVWLFDLTWLESILLGAVVASTDAAAVFATLRFTHIRRRLARTLEAETGGNDPMAIALTIGLIAWIENPNYGFGDLVLLVVRQLGHRARRSASCSAPWRCGSFARLPPSIGAFAPVASVAAAALSFGVADVARRQRLPGRLPRRPRGRQHAVALPAAARRLPRGARLPRAGGDVRRARPARLSERPAGRSRSPGLALAALLMVVIRPVAVWVSTAFSRFTNRERALLGWAGLRGAVPIVLGTFVLSAGLRAAARRSSTPSSSSSSSRRWCRGRRSSGWPSGSGLIVARAADDRAAARRSSRSARSSSSTSTSRADHAIAGAAVRELGLPRTALVAVVARGDETIPPRGSTVIQPGDRLFVLAPRDQRADARGRLRPLAAAHLAAAGRRIRSDRGGRERGLRSLDGHR